MNKYIIETKSGKVAGFKDEEKNLVKYLGIPYAKPPVGKLRFKRAQAIEPWDGVYDAAAFGAVSVQYFNQTPMGSEDCLTLNVVRPENGENLPVFLWIHGGGYNTGCASDALSCGDSFAKEGIVYVSIQYRLNVLGFYDFTTFEGCEEMESNCGLSDQLLALRWVHENIAAFGGNPEQITIAGESAGAASVINLLAAPSAKGLFAQAIVESGLPNCVMSHEMARENIEIFMEGMGWTKEDLPKLYTGNPYSFFKGNEAVAAKHQYKNPGMFLPGPVIDDLLPERPIDAIAKGSADGVRLIIGTNTHEGTMFVHPENTGFPNSWEMVREMLEKHGYEDHFEEVKAYYSDETKHHKDGTPFIHFATDYAFLMPSLKVANGHKAYGPVWMYRFDFMSPAAKEIGMFASHAFDLPCVFADKDFEFSKLVFGGSDEKDIDAMIEELHGKWVSFIKTGAPDCEENWPEFEGYHSKFRIFDAPAKTESIDYTELMNVWGDMRFYEE